MGEGNPYRGPDGKYTSGGGGSSSSGDSKPQSVGPKRGVFVTPQGISSSPPPTVSAKSMPRKDALGRGIVEKQGGQESYAGVKDDEWEQWAHQSTEVNAALAGTLQVGDYNNSDNSKITAQDLQQYKEIATKVQAAASNNVAVISDTHNQVFRGESYDSIEEVKAKYKHNAVVKTSGLTSTTVDQSIAHQYADTGVNNGAKVAVLVKYQNLNGIPGIQTAPLGVPSNEIVMPKGATFRVAGVDVEGNKVTVRMYSTEKHPGKNVINANSSAWSKKL